MFYTNVGRTDGADHSNVLTHSVDKLAFHAYLIFIHLIDSKYLTNFHKDIQWPHLTKPKKHALQNWDRNWWHLNLFCRNLIPPHTTIRPYSTVQKNRHHKQYTCIPHPLQYRLAMTYGKYVQYDKVTGSHTFLSVVKWLLAAQWKNDNSPVSIRFRVYSTMHYLWEQRFYTCKTLHLLIKGTWEVQIVLWKKSIFV